jgi:hypothetical protein
MKKNIFIITSAMLFVLIFILIIPNALAAVCVNQPQPLGFSFYDTSTWHLLQETLGSCTPTNSLSCVPVISDNCISGYHGVAGGNPAIGLPCFCVCERDPCCGDGNIDSGEECDNGTLVPTGLPYNPFVPGWAYVNTSLNDDTLACTHDCQITPLPRCGDGVLNSGEECDNGTANSNSGLCNLTCQETTCGDGIIQWPNGIHQGGLPVDSVLGYEECDGLDLNGQSCQTKDFDTGTLGCFGPVAANKCVFDTSLCRDIFCGDNICEDTETTQSCFRDCEISGWHTDDDGWNITLADQLTFSQFNGVIYSDPFELRVGSTYTLSAIINTQYCSDVLLDFYDANCTDGATGLVYTECFNNQFVSQTEDQKTFTVIDLGTHASNNYLTGVRLRIRAIDCDTSRYPTIDDVSLTEVPTAHIDYTPGIDAVAACCPAQWCWDGNTCVDSELWMDNSSYPPIWNQVFNSSINPWINEHVNSSYQNNADGYRCVNSSGSAQWIPSPIKYDWNFKSSGYCNQATDCFVNNTQNYTEGRAGCIHSGEYVNDALVLGSGMHYCNNGVWGTRTELMANALVSFANDKPFILFCDTNNNTFNFVDAEEMNKFNSITSGCTIVVKNSASDEQVITAFYVGGNDATINDVLGKLFIIYGNAFDNSGTTTPEVSRPWNPGSSLSCIDLPTGFIKCVGSGTPSPNNVNNLALYYNNNSNFFILSSKDVDMIDPSLWTNIRNFFSRLFGLNPQTAGFYGFFNQTTNFNNVYLLQNNTLSVFAVQEDKYDESDGRIYNYTYINYTDNKISLRNTVNEFYLSSLYGSNFTLVKSGWDGSAYGTQEIFIKSGKNIAVWPYLTAMLRDRDTPNP